MRVCLIDSINDTRLSFAELSTDVSRDLFAEIKLLHLLLPACTCRSLETLRPRGHIVSLYLIISLLHKQSFVVNANCL